MISSVSQRWRDRVGSYRLATEIIQTRDYEVAEIPDDTTAKNFVCANHYSGSFPAARFRYGLYERGGALVGVAVFSHPSNPLSLRPLLGKVEGFESRCELGRFVLLDRVPGNGETWFLARAFDLLEREGITGIVSFSDPFPRTDVRGARVFRGHVGTIYQAHNACFLGQVRGDILRLLPDGRVLHNRSLAKVRVKAKGWRYVVEGLVYAGAHQPTEEDQASLVAWLASWVPILTRKVKHPGNLKYAWVLDKRFRRELPVSKPYPKFDMVRRVHS